MMQDLCNDTVVLGFAMMHVVLCADVSVLCVA